MSYATIIPGQSIGKSSERKSQRRFSWREWLQHCNSFLIQHIPLSAHRLPEPVHILITDPCGSNSARNQFFPFPQKQSSEKIIKFETSLKERVSLINVPSVGQTPRVLHKVSPCQDEVQLPAQVMGIYSLKSTDFCTETQQIQAGHWCPSTEKWLQPAGFSDFQMGKAADKVRIPAVKESLSLGQKEYIFLERGGKKDL